MSTLELIKQGEDLFSAGKLEEAEKCFLAAIKNNPDNSEAANNLAVLALARNDLEAATNRIADCLRADPYHRTSVLNSVEIFRKLKRLDLARPILEHFQQRFPDDAEVAKILSSLPTPPTPAGKMAVLCPPGMDNFLEPVLKLLQTTYEVRYADTADEEQLNQTLRWADEIWIEYAAEAAVALTNSLPMQADKRVICRLHSYEAFGGYLSKIKWERIDDLIFVAPHLRDQVLQHIPDLADRVRRLYVIPNGVDLDKYPYVERRPGKNLAYLGYINYKKGPMLLLHALAELVRHDPEYRLHVAGLFQDERYGLYFAQMTKELGLTDNLVLDGWVTDVAGWLQDKNYVISTSVLESQGMGIMEAMAAGIKPVVHNFVGAANVYDREFLWNSIPQFVAMITASDYDSERYRAFIETRYSLAQQQDQLQAVIKAGQNDQHTLESPCGEGSYLVNTSEIRRFLPEMIAKHGIKSMIDVGCGDLNWLKTVDLGDVTYTGYDQDEGFIEANRQHSPHLAFETVDVRTVAWPKVDLILCRDLLIHLSHSDALQLLAAFKTSGARYLITTTYDDADRNVDFTAWQKSHKYTRACRASRKLNLQKDPFTLGAPLESIRENQSEACQGRLIGLWDLAED